MPKLPPQYGGVVTAASRLGHPTTRSLVGGLQEALAVRGARQSKRCGVEGGGVTPRLVPIQQSPAIGRDPQVAGMQILVDQLEPVARERGSAVAPQVWWQGVRRPGHRWVTRPVGKGPPKPVHRRHPAGDLRQIPGPAVRPRMRVSNRQPPAERAPEVVASASGTTNPARLAMRVAFCNQRRLASLSSVLRATAVASPTQTAKTVLRAPAASGPSILKSPQAANAAGSAATLPPTPRSPPETRAG